ncbi:unnamed protein product [Rotaria sp. Silwood2]|nr:unnamed protein product [Rotaria sp. Silwood2]CAF3196537.1 unnamed protein product [Rotaria sp. Silwood2]CAF4150439.1 unnamed protein product [Rotaria sp. Silwood2]CAF4401090.1 unnamed protein product [Rotaria sp. Silwood2]
MVSFIFVSLSVLVVLGAAFNNDDAKFHNYHFKRIPQINENQLTLQNTLKKIVNNKKSAIHSTDDEKQQYPLSYVAAATESISIDSSIKLPDDFACLEACDTCIEDYPAAFRKKKSFDGCGPVCECANSCTRMSIEQIDKIYGQEYSRQTDKGCFLRVYFQMLNK